MTGRFRALAVTMVALLAMAIAAAARSQEPAVDEYFEAIDHPSIAYHATAPQDPVAQLSRRLAAGTATLEFNEQTGYLPSLLAALDIPVSSQLAVFSKTSLQRGLISPQNPRAIYFNDSVMVAWPRGGFIEISAQDPRQGVMFYMLPQQPMQPVMILRRNDCLTCHHSYDTNGVPGLLEKSVVTGPRGEAMPFLGNYLIDDRSPLEERWAGWLVTGSSGQARHLGNQTPPATRDLSAQVPAKTTAVTSFPEALTGYLSTHSDVVAHLVFDHQLRVVNLLTRTGWQVRLAEAERGNVAAVADRAARALVDALLFVNEAPLPDGITGSSDFGSQFTARGPSDSKGRTLRMFDLHTRLMRYPCSFMIYSAAFDALPPAALDAVYRRLWSVLSGEERDLKYSRIAAADRTAVIEILRETKKGLPDYFRQPF